MSAPVKRGYPRRVSDEVIVDMLGMAGSVAAAARALGYTPQGLRRRASTRPAVAAAIAAVAEGSKSGRRSSAPSREVLAALCAEHGTDAAVARHLGCSRLTVRRWRSAHGIEPQRRRGSSSARSSDTRPSGARLSVAEIVRGLDAAPSAQEGAAALGYTKQALYLRAKTSPEIRDALTRAALRGTVRALTDDAIRAALNASLTLGEAAEALGVGAGPLRVQVARRGLTSELDATKARGWEARTLYSDDVIVEAFRQHGVLTRVASALGTGVQTLFYRLRDPGLAARVAPFRRDGRAR